MNDMEEESSVTLKGNKRVLEDSSDEGELIESASDSDMDENMKLPEDLLNISRKERRDLYRFKKQHTEMEFEAEVMRRMDELQSKRDHERLKKLMVGAKKDTPAAAAKRAPKPKAAKVKEKSTAPRSTKRVKVNSLSDDDEEAGSVGEEDDNDDDLFDDDDDDELYESSEDDLFGEDELEEINRSTKRTDVSDSEGKGRAPRTGRLAKGTARGKSTYSEQADEEDEGYASEGGSTDGGPSGRGKGSESRARRKPAAATSASTRTKKVNRLSEVTTALDDDEYEDEGLGKDDGDYSEDEESDAAAERKQKRAAERRRYAALEAEEEENPTPADLNDYLRLQTRRVYLEKWLKEPFFEDVVKGSYVRFHVGQANGVPVYRMAEVLDITESKRSYKMPGTDIVVDKMLLLGVGRSQKAGRLEKVSNSRITPHEFAQFVTLLKDHRMEDKLLSKKQADKRREWMHQRLHHTYTHQEISSIISKDSSRNRALTTTFGAAVKKLEEDLAEARANEEFDKMEQLQKDIEKIQREIRLNKERYSNHYGVFTDINKRNKKINLQLDMEAGERRKRAELSGDTNSLAKNLEDPFARRDTRPKVLWVTGAKKIKEPEAGGEEETKEAPAVLAEASKTKPRLTRELSMPSNEEVSDPAELGRLLEEKFGFANPWATHQLSKAERYIRQNCGHLPLLHSGERETLREGISLAQYFNNAPPPEDGGDMEVAGQ